MKILGTDFVLYHVRDFPAAVMFYRDVLELPLLLCSEEWEWAEFDAGNVTLALKGGEEVLPGDHAPRLALAVANIAAAQKELQSRGVQIIGAAADHGVCQSLELLDPDGNVVLLHHRTDGSVGQQMPATAAPNAVREPQHVS